MTKAAILAANGSLMTAPSGTAPAYQCRAWVNFNGTGTVAIRASGNVSSITDNGTGDYRVNFTTAMPDSNYAVSGSADVYGGGVYVVCVDHLTLPTSSVRISVTNGSATYTDRNIISVAFFR